MEHMTAGYDSGDKTMLQTVAYVSFQELATRVSHRNTGKATGCPMAEKLLARISVDENLHMVFYGNLVAAALESAPNETREAIRDEVIMPVLKFWKVFERSDFGPRGEAAREELSTFLTGLDAQATRFVERREASRERAMSRA
jgi:acyl-[acyl-carrier-protein] desaturase